LSILEEEKSMAVELTFEQLKDLARSHWKKHLPKFYRNLKKSGELERRVENAARFTLDAFNLEKARLEKKGVMRVRSIMLDFLQGIGKFEGW
jgi:hypothetical protein